MEALVSLLEVWELPAASNFLLLSSVLRLVGSLWYSTAPQPLRTVLPEGVVYVRQKQHFAATELTSMHGSASSLLPVDALSQSTVDS